MNLYFIPIELYGKIYCDKKIGGCSVSNIFIFTVKHYLPRFDQGPISIPEEEYSALPRLDITIPQLFYNSPSKQKIIHFYHLPPPLPALPSDSHLFSLSKRLKRPNPILSGVKYYRNNSKNSPKIIVCFVFTTRRSFIIDLLLVSCTISYFLMFGRGNKCTR